MRLVVWECKACDHRCQRNENETTTPPEGKCEVTERQTRYTRVDFIEVERILPPVLFGAPAKVIEDYDYFLQEEKNMRCRIKEVMTYRDEYRIHFAIRGDGERYFILGNRSGSVRGVLKNVNREKYFNTYLRIGHKQTLGEASIDYYGNGNRKVSSKQSRGED